MAPSSSSTLHHFSLFSLILLISFSSPRTLVLALSKPKPPNSLFLPISKVDGTSLQTTTQYITHIKQRTPLVPVNLTVDLGGRSLWVVIDDDYISSTRTIHNCNSTQCKLASRTRVCPFGDPCFLPIHHPTLGSSQVGSLCDDVISLQSTNANSYTTIPHYLFGCATNYMIVGLADGITGAAGLGRSKIALPLQLASAFKFDKKFVLCLPSSTNAKGFVVFGNFVPNTAVSPVPLTYTPLLNNPVSTVPAPRGEPSYEYFIGVKSITINGKLLSIDRKSGNGGTKISTGHPYTALKTEIYNAFIEAFVREAEAMKLKRVAAVEPFGACFRFGPAVPMIDFVLESKNVWRMFGANSMVKVGNNGVMCLGFVEGDYDEMTSVVIGGRQLENIVLQFDLASSKMAHKLYLHVHPNQLIQGRIPQGCRHEMPIKSVQVQGSLIKAGKQEDLTELMMDRISKGERLS
ncbi:hypothetical protein Syun_029073 [Stephania yunnanensis]|uniref:Peptidase A1 domain-containing protein n=1 Tax=Stephania yunnanensis TaxID=152371 RepID=A0AAP0ECY1_9MAGN